MLSKVERHKGFKQCDHIRRFFNTLNFLKLLGNYFFGNCDQDFGYLGRYDFNLEGFLPKTRLHWRFYLEFSLGVFTAD